MDFAFQNVVKYILRFSKVNVTLIRISNVNEDSFHVSIEARTTNTGPASATLSSFTIDLCGPIGRFGQVHLPAITTQSDGAPIIVTNQLVKISDKGALQAFIGTIICDGQATLTLKNGNTTVKAMGIGPRPICYEKDLPMTGMSGPNIKIQTATATGPSNLAVTIQVANPSPLEISFGICGFEIQNENGEVFAELKGRLDIRCNSFEASLQGTVDKRVKVKGQARIVGKRCAGAGWCDETVKGINVPVAGLQKVFNALSMEYEFDESLAEEIINEKEAIDEPPVKSSNISSRWHGRFWRTQL